MTDDRGQTDPVEALLDLLVYAPLGLVTQLDELLPGLIEKGRSQAVMARTIGEFAVRSGSQKVHDRAGDTQKQLEGLVRYALELAASRLGSTMGSDGSDGSDGVEAEHDTDQQTSERGLPIDGYDELRASDIVPMLSSLSRPDLEAIAAHETANRSRRTILNRIQQLGVELDR